MAETLLDTRGLNCPLPVLRARKAMQKLAPGGLLRVLATDPGTVKDLQGVLPGDRARALESREQDGEFRFVIRKA